MSRNRFIATQLTPVEAHELWERSDEASAFTRPDYLAQLVDEVEWWGAQRSGETLAAWPLVRASSGGEIGAPPFCYYLGPMFARTLGDDKYLRYWTAYIDIFTALIEALAEHHPQFRFSLPIGMSDVRPLEWWNHDHPGGPAFTTRPRYTARIDLSEFHDGNALYTSFARDRRRHIRHWTAHPPTIVEDVTTDRLIVLHDEALQRNGFVAEPERHTALRRMVRLVQSGAGATIGLVPEGATEIEAVIVLLDGPAESNNVLCTASNTWRDQGLTTWAVWQGLLRGHSLARHWFDFNGANSPGRARDKHLYSAKSALYFDCRFGLANPNGVA